MNRLVKILIPVLIILGLILAAGCATKQTSVTAPPYAGGAIPAPAVPETASSVLGLFDRGNTYEAAYRSIADESGTPDIDRKIVRNGYMTLEVNDITVALTGVAAIALDLNGYVVSSNKSGDQDITYGQISIRVPSDRFDEAFDKLRQLAVNVPNESTTSQDVTEQYTDLQAQLRNYEATEAQYLELLKKAEKVEDILAVQRELSNVRGQIEQVKGRIQYIERTSDMALIEVNLHKVKPIGGTAWSALETLKSAARGLVSFGKALADVLIWVAIFSPVWIIILVVVLYFTRWRKKAKTTRK
ncbi:MAG: hypothetical protein A2Z70_02465 [Chloroflexi bacterium RBG_13_48_17]|nr:MAG: hypothetical protein A2Z70_02465 [Chloroflexi bacterium RBG_13_48_17]